MKLFVSWSGEKSRRYAECFAEWLPLFTPTVTTWFSPDDIDKGTRWLTELATQLDDHSFGVLFVTKQNAQSPWLNFEAGALSKTVGNSKVCPILIDLSFGQLPGTLSQFQSTQFQADDMHKLVLSINKYTVEPRKESHIRALFSRLWQDLLEKAQEINAQHPVTESSHDRVDFVDEVLIRLKAIESKLATHQVSTSIADIAATYRGLSREELWNRERLLLEQIEAIAELSGPLNEKFRTLLAQRDGAQDIPPVLESLNSLRDNDAQLRRELGHVQSALSQSSGDATDQ